MVTVHHISPPLFCSALLPPSPAHPVVRDLVLLSLDPDPGVRPERRLMMRSGMFSAVGCKYR